MYIEIDVFSLFLLGDGFKYVKKFTPTCEDDPIWRAYFSNGLVQPQTSLELTRKHLFTIYREKVMRQRAWIITVDILQIDPLAFSKFILANRCVLCIALSILKSLFFCLKLRYVCKFCTYFWRNGERQNTKVWLFKIQRRPGPLMSFGSHFPPFRSCRSWATT